MFKCHTLIIRGDEIVNDDAIADSLSVLKILDAVTGIYDVTIYDVRFTRYDLRCNDLRCTIYDLRSTIYDVTIYDVTIYEVRFTMYDLSF